MNIKTAGSSLSFNLDILARVVNTALPLMVLTFGLLGYWISFYFHFLTVIFFLVTAINFHYRHIQKQHVLLANFGFVAQLRYMIESTGPEFRQYLFLSDVEEKPFNRIERSGIYRKAKGMDASSAFGSQLAFDHHEIKLRHSMYPAPKSELLPYRLVFGENRGASHPYALHKPVIISAMSYGALGHRAVRVLARGARKAGILMNTGEGGFPKYHLMEGCDLIFQMGTAKFGVRHDDGSLNDKKLEEMAKLDQIKMIEIKFSQGAKPGKGGLLPKEKISEEISQLRGVPMGKDVISPPSHLECTSPPATVAFIDRVQKISGLPVGIKLCLGVPREFRELILEMKRQAVFPDYISIDGGEGGTGAAPTSFMDDVGVPILQALPLVQEILQEEGVRDRLRLLCAGKMIDPGRQFTAFSLGADAIYTARGFMMAIGCIQTLQCNRNTCPVGITTHDPMLEHGLDIEEKSERVKNYVDSLMHDFDELLSAMGKRSIRDLRPSNLFQKGIY